MSDYDLDLLKAPSRFRLIFASIDQETLNKIDLLSAESRRSRSDIICRCLAYSLDRLEIVDPE